MMRCLSLRKSGRQRRLAEIIRFAARLALECIGNSDALYHDVEHTMLVTLAGHDIFKGRALLTGSTPADYSNFIAACLTHDIGYLRGILKGDGNDGYVVDDAGHKITLPRGCSDAALAPHHVEPSKVFVLDRLAAIEELDSARIAGAIEHTRFPYSSAPEDRDIDEDAALLRAADLIGQLGDPGYLGKVNALYCEFEEIGLHRQLGNESPPDLADNYPEFYWRALSQELYRAAQIPEVSALAQAAVAARHVWNASPLRRRSVLRDVRWRWTLNVLWTAA